MLIFSHKKSIQNPKFLSLSHNPKSSVTIQFRMNGCWSFFEAWTSGVWLANNFPAKIFQSHVKINWYLGTILTFLAMKKFNKVRYFSSQLHPKLTGSKNLHKGINFFHTLFTLSISFSNYWKKKLKISFSFRPFFCYTS